MSRLFRNVKTKLYDIGGVDEEIIRDAEKRLQLRFDEEFERYLEEYGVVSFGGHEFMGLGGDAYLDVVEETLREKGENPMFPANCYIVENLGIDGMMILQSEEGGIYELSAAGCKKIAERLLDYVDMLEG